MKNDLLPDRLKYFWADDEEGPYQGPFDSRDLAVSDAYCYRAKCFDDPSQTDGLFMIKTKGLLVDAVESPEYVLSIDVTDEFHDTWKTRADLASTPNKSAEVDLDGLRGDVYAEVSRYCVGAISPTDAGLGAKIAIDYLAASGHLATGKGGDDLSDRVSIAIETCKDVTNLGHFSKAVDPVEWVRALQEYLEGKI